MEKYFARMMGRDGVVRRWSVLDDTFEGTATELTLTGDGIVIREDYDEAAFAPVRSWTGYVTIFDNGNVRDLIAKSGHQRKTEVKKENGEVEWSGFVTPEIRTQYFPQEGSELQVPIRGRLATAGGYYLEREGVQNFVTLGALLEECLRKVGFNSVDEVWWPKTYGVDKVKNSGLRLLAMKVSRARFLRQGTENDTIDESNAVIYPADCLTVISEIMKIFGYTLCERRGVLQIISVGPADDLMPMEVEYQVVFVGFLHTIYEGVNLENYDWRNTEINYVELLEGTEQSTSYCQGTKGVRVEVQLDRESASEFPSTSLEQFGFVGDYVRYISKNSVRMKVNAFAGHAANIETFVYTREAKGEEVADGWYPAKVEDWLNADGELDDYTLSDTPQDHACRAGMFPARMARYSQQEYDSGALKNYDYVDGYCFNPNETEGSGAYHGPYIDNRFPLLRMRSGKEMSYKGGAIVFDFTIGGRTPKSANHGSPLDYGVKVYCELMIGAEWWNNDTKSWQSKPHKFEIGLENTGTTLFGVPSSRVADTKTIHMPYNGVHGYIVELKDPVSGEPIEKIGELNITLYIHPTLQNSEQKPTGGESKSYFYLFLTDLAISYHENDNEVLRRTTGNQKNTRTLSKRTTQGFDNDFVKTSLMLGSFSYESGTALSTLTYDGKNVQKIIRVYDGAKRAPEEFLLSNLLRYYDRIVERRELTVPFGTITDAANIVEIEKERWRQVAIAVNYGQGVERVVVERGVNI